MVHPPHIEADDDESSSSSSDESSSSSDDSQHAPINSAQHHTDDDDVSSEQRQVKKWTLQIPIGLGLCPWASKSHNQGNLRFVTCRAETPRDVAVCVQREIQRLVCVSDGEPPPWRTTLVICPNVNEWNETFPTFDRFVSNEIWDQFEQDDNDECNISTISDDITLVAFHPNFLRWHGLPDKIEKGSVVQSHYGIIGKKSVETAQATIVETCNKAFGMRRVKVRFHDACNDRRQEQYVPSDWISIPLTDKSEVERGDSTTSDPSQRGPALPDNAMHQAPHPTIHIINNADLASLSIRDISRVKRKNAHRMMKLGWDGVKQKLNTS